MSFNNKAFLDHYAGGETYFHYNEMDDTAAIEITADVEPIIEQNKARQNMGENAGKSACGNYYVAADIPLVIIQQWANEQGITADELLYDENYWPLLRRKLNDKDNEFLRVWKGNIA